MRKKAIFVMVLLTAIVALSLTLSPQIASYSTGATAVATCSCSGRFIYGLIVGAIGIIALQAVLSEDE